VEAAEDDKATALEFLQASSYPEVRATWDHALQEIRDVLTTLNKIDICEIKALKCPPSILLKVLGLVCRLFMMPALKGKNYETGEACDDWWRTSQRLLLSNTSGFMQHLMNGLVDVEPQCTDPVIDTVKAGLKELEDDCQGGLSGFERTARCSRAGEVFHRWMHAFVQAWDGIGGQEGMKMIQAEKNLHISNERIESLFKVNARGAD